MADTDVFGFPIKPAGGEGGDFTPVLQYNAKAGRFFRVDRVDNGNGFENEPVDVTDHVKFIADFENVEVGWILFASGQAPDFRLVPIGSQLPPQPSQKHDYGIRFMLKLSKECGGDRPVREIAGTSKAFRGAIEAVYTAYLAQRDANPGKLPVLTVEKIMPVKSTGGGQTSTNFHPVFRIYGWAPRGDLVFVPKAGATPIQTLREVSAALGAVPPSTGSTQAAPPQATATADADDFG